MGFDFAVETHIASGTSISLTHTIGATATGLTIFVCSFATTVDFISSISVGAATPTLANQSGNTGGFAGWVDTFVLNAPPTGSQTITANFTGNIPAPVSMVVVSEIGGRTDVSFNPVRGGNNFSQGFNSAAGAQSTSIGALRTGSLGLFCWFGEPNSPVFSTQTGGTTNKISYSASTIAVQLDYCINTAGVSVNDGYTTDIGNLYQFSVIEKYPVPSVTADPIFYGAD